MEIAAPLFRAFQKDPRLKQNQFDINPAIAGYYRARASELDAERAKDVNTQDQALAAWDLGLPGLEKSTAADQSFLEGLRPGGTQERRFSDLIRGYMDKARLANQVGLDRARAQEKARTAIGGNSAFADSGYRQAQRNAMESGFESGLAKEEGAAQINNANTFLRNYRPGAALGLATDASRARLTPLAIRGTTEQLGAGRASGVLGGLRGSIDTMYNWEKPKNWATYAEAADQTIGNIIEIYASLYSGGAMGGKTTSAPKGGAGGNAAAFSGGGGSYGGWGSGGANGSQWGGV